MDIYKIIGELVTERNRILRIIASLEGMGEEGKKAIRSPAARGRGRKSMDGTARKEVSERMKRYWARKRAERREDRDMGSAE
jgi:hypothetical protein